MKTGLHNTVNIHAGWASAALWLCIVIASSMQPTICQAQSDHLGVHASAQAHAVVDWILSSNDHQGLPFAVVDKVHAHVFVFNNQGHLMGDAPALLGLARGDDGVEGIGERAMSKIRPEERITPSGRFMANLARNLLDQEILWVNYEQSISMHALRSADPKERRPERLASATVLDNRISYGCINLPPAFWRDIVQPVFKNTPGVVYVLPETRSVQSEFGIPIKRRP